MIPKILQAMPLLAACSHSLFAECSDSGFCQLPSSEPAAQDSSWSTGIGVSLGAGDTDESLAHQTVEASISWHPRTGTQITLAIPWVRNVGDRGSAHGLGDVQMGFAQHLLSDGIGAFELLLGIRLPTGDDAALKEAPLGYQPGLGSTDLLAGIGWNRAGFDARLGYIAALGTNGTPGIELARGDDLALGGGYSVARDAWDVRGGFLLLHRLADATVTDGAGGRTTLSDSAGTQANAQVTIGWTPATAIRLQGVAAKALLAREENAGVDGLTRSWALSVSGTVSW